MAKLCQKLTYILLWLTVFTIPFQRAFVLPGIGSLNKLVGIPFVVMVLYTILMKKRIKKLPLFFYLVIMFFFVNIATYFITSTPSDTLEKSLLFLQLGFITWSIYEFTENKKEINKLLYAFVLGCMVLALQTFYLYLSGDPQSEGTRFTVDGYNLNHSGIILTLGIPMAIYLALNSKKRIILLYIPIAMFSIFLTGSRTAFILLVIMLISFIWLLFRYKIKYKKMLLLFLFLVTLFIVNQIPHKQIERIGTINEEVSTGTLNSRTDIWDSGFSVFVQQPLLGVGAGGYQEAVEKVSGLYASAHNAYISVLTENGIVGLVLFLSMLVVVIISSLKTSSYNFTKWLSITLIISWLILSLTSHSEAQKYTWVLFGIIITSHSIDNAQNLTTSKND